MSLFKNNAIYERLGFANTCPLGPRCPPFGAPSLYFKSLRCLWAPLGPLCIGKANTLDIAFPAPLGAVCASHYVGDAHIFLVFRGPFGHILGDAAPLGIYSGPQRGPKGQYIEGLLFLALRGPKGYCRFFVFLVTPEGGHILCFAPTFRP